MNKTFNKTWDSKEYEQKLYEDWEKSGYFKPEINMPENPKYDRAIEGKPFVIPIPPPNVTGKLHIGHSLFITIQDIMIRFRRMLGEPTLWIPGTDHAGIATQTVVDKALRKKGINRHEIGREKFVEEVWKWKEEYGGIITDQLKRMGASCDWSRERFTLDPSMSEAVTDAFVHLYEKGLIYRGEYIVNWCPKCGTAIADDEMNHEEQTAKLFYFKYDKAFPITIATTRPETKFGDTAVAVNPSDPRYEKYIGQDFDFDLDGVKRRIKIIADRSIDMKFGTGAVGITPAHSPIDWKMGEANHLPVIKVIDERAKMTAEAGKYEGLKVLEAREKLVEYLKSEKLLEKEETITNNLSICYRCDTAIEPIPSLQWFVKMRPLAEKAKKAVEDGDIKILPRRFEKVYYQWMDNIRDWCISRQLWWGHRIPVWYREKTKVSNQSSKLWDLKIYGEGIFQGLVDGSKTIEIRAGRPETDEKYWGNFKPGDRIEFRLADEESDKIIDTKENPIKNVKSVRQFENFDDLFAANEDYYKRDYPGHTKEQLKEWWMTRFPDRINKYGLWVIEFEYPQSQEIYCGKTVPEGEGWIQDEDVLDTWFSSGLWPFSTLGWPEETKDLQYFYPATVLATAYDLLFFWVARMIMMGLELTDKIPYEIVYMHGLVRDEHNRKISKSLGNGIDPLELIERYGTDALRMGLVVGTTAGQDIPVGENKIKGYRNFSNKIWNASRFVSLRVSGGDLASGELGEDKIENLAIDSSILSDADKSILEAHEELKKKVTADLKEYKFSSAGELLYEYFWHNFCDIYIEQSKSQLEDNKTAENTKKILIKILSESLQMLHPFVPYVTEAIWQELREIYHSLSKSIMISKWPA